MITHHALYEMATTQYMFARRVKPIKAITQFVISLLYTSWPGGDTEKAWTIPIPVAISKKGYEYIF